MHSIVAFGMLALAGLSAAQDSPQNNYPYTINPDDVPDSTRQSWCDNQQAACPLICLQQPGVSSSDTVSNDCDPDALTYSCVCDNNVSPNITQFSQTLPYYICTEWGNECVSNCNGDNTCADKCRSDHPCGAQEPFKGNATASPSHSTAASTAGSTGTGAADAGATARLGDGGNGGSSGAANSIRPAVFEFAKGYSMVVVFAGVFAGFAILL